MSGPTAAQIARFAGALETLGARGPIGVAVSGGPDSLALLLLAHAARPGGVEAATVDHGLRPEAAGEARFVAALCRRLAVPHQTLTVVVAEEGEGRQAAARVARYAALAGWAVARALPALATAHHVDDQAETMLMRLARGSGVTGLAGVRPSRPLAEGVALIRPLLGWRREELGAIVAAARITPVDDPANRDPRYDRTQARALLAGGWPAPGRIAAAARNLADADEALAWAAVREEHRIAPDGDGFFLDPHGLPDEIVRRLVAQALRRLGEEAAIPGPDLARLIDRLRAGEHATLRAVKASPGARWRFAPAPPHRA